VPCSSWVWGQSSSLVKFCWFIAPDLAPVCSRHKCSSHGGIKEVCVYRLAHTRDKTHPGKICLPDVYPLEQESAVPLEPVTNMPWTRLEDNHSKGTWMASQSPASVVAGLHTYTLKGSGWATLSQLTHTTSASPSISFSV
jgi:hypothetical protein